MTTPTTFQLLREHPAIYAGDGQLLQDPSITTIGDGAVLHDGTTIIRWRTEPSSTSVYASIEELLRTQPVGTTAAWTVEEDEVRDRLQAEFDQRLADVRVELERQMQSAQRRVEYAARVSGNPVLGEVAAEREAQNEKWGEQSYPDGTGAGVRVLLPVRDVTGAARFGDLAEWARARCDVEHSGDAGTWEQVLTEEWGEALAEEDPQKLRAELIQVAAVAVQWVEAIDRREVQS